MGRPVAIVHFQPLELYPPVMNLLSYIQRLYPGCPVIVYTNADAAIGKFSPGKGSITIRQLAEFKKGQTAYARYFNYFLFYTRCFIQLLKTKPAKILYYETLSAWPVWAYTKFISRSTPVFIHYHEYTSPAEYTAGMKLACYFHNREKWLYPRAAWISHTNAERLQQFTRDEQLDEVATGHILPNYPPQGWIVQKVRNTKPPLKIVYIGALSLDTMYTGAFAKWVLDQEGAVAWHIYTNNITADARAYIESIPGGVIELRAGVGYSELPDVLKHYDVGVILYNGHIPNYVYNAPNKLFEYMACGLDTWFSNTIKGCFPYITGDMIPGVFAVDFTLLDSILLPDFYAGRKYSYESPEYYYERVYPLLTEKLLECCI